MRWNDSDRLIRLFPDKYKEIHMKLEALKTGMPYKIYDATDELKNMIMDMGAKIWGVQQTYGKNNRLVKSYKRNNYKYKTDIPEFVDEVIKKSMEV